MSFAHLGLTRFQFVLQVLSTMHETIAVSRKCCYSCHLLGEILQEKRNKKFNLFGTHGRVDPWMPPTGLDFETLSALKARLVQELGRVVERRRESHTVKQNAPLSRKLNSYNEPSPAGRNKLRITPRSQF